MIDQRTAGTWVLQQVSSVSELDQLRSQIDRALDLPGVVGLSIRWPWKSDPDLVILDRAAVIAQAHDKMVAGRFMAGRHTPPQHMGNSRTVSGVTFPLPWDVAGGLNTAFLAGYGDYAQQVIDRHDNEGMPIAHMSWWAKDWAELNHGAEIRAAPGYTYDRWLAGHKAMIDTARTRAVGTGVTVEFPLSGYGPLSNGQSAALAQYMVDSTEDWDTTFTIQANGTNETQEWGAPNAQVEQDFRDAIWPKPLLRGCQMIQPQQYDWARVYGRVRAVGASYLEVYLPSFAGTTSLAAEAERFYNDVREEEPPPPPPPPPPDPCAELRAQVVTLTNERDQYASANTALAQRIANAQAALTGP